jgi:soluble lytic murein transglycosylase
MACSLPGQPNIIVVTATPSQIPVTPTITPIPPTPTPTPTPTPVPTPTTAPNVAISQADTALHNGDYASAVTIYRSILTRPILSVDPRLRADAAIGLGTAALREGQFGDAVAALSDFIQVYPTDNRVAQSLFLRGDAYLGLEQWANAIVDFKAYLQKRPGLVDSYVYERIGDAYLALRNPEQALASYNQAVTATRGLVPMLALREKVAAAYLNANNVTAAIGQYDAILAVARVPEYRANIAFTAADVLFRTGNKAAAYARYQKIIGDYPETPEGYRAMKTLLAGGAQIDDLLRGRISFAAKDYNDTITALYNYTSKTALADVDPAVFLTLGRAYREVNNSDAANKLFQIIIDSYVKSPLYGVAWLEQGRTLYLAGKVQEAIAKYKDLAEKHPDVPEGAEALWRAGYLYSTLGDTESSLATFEILGNMYKGTDWAMDGLFRGGMAAYNQHANGRAQRLFSILATTGKGNLKAAGALWLGRLYQLDGQPQLARDAYTEAAKADPGGYYSLRAADLLAGHGPFVSPARIDLSYNDPARLAEADQWLRKTFNIKQTGDLSALSPTLANDPRLIRGNELWSVAAYDDAKGEFTSLNQDNESNPLALYQLATYYSKIGLYRLSIETTAKLLDGAKIETADAPKAIAALRFPTAYYDLILPAAQKFSVDPLLVFSVIRQESLFEGVATSYASAQGLMQIIPDTGAYIAQKLAWPDYQNSDIYRPYVNVTFGVYYLHEQLQTFNGNVYAALAAYNAGPAASAEWFRISQGDPDLFIQAIAYDETQTYVRRIYEQYSEYAAIYRAN